MKTRYAFKALSALARSASDQPTLIGDLATAEGIPRKFLESILRELKQHGFLSAQRGRGGGYALRQSPADITLASVIRALDGPLAPVPCLSRTAYRRCDDCRSERDCAVRLVLKEAHDAAAKVLEATTLADLVRKAPPAERHEPQRLAYTI